LGFAGGFIGKLRVTVGKLAIAIQPCSPWDDGYPSETNDLALALWVIWVKAAVNLSWLCV
jgi:hypothetical protein